MYIAMDKAIQLQQQISTMEKGQKRKSVLSFSHSRTLILSLAPILSQSVFIITIMFAPQKRMDAYLGYVL